QGRLARPGRAHDGHVVAAVDAQRHPPQGVHGGLAVAVHLGHVTDLEDRMSHQLPLRRTLTAPPVPAPPAPPNNPPPRGKPVWLVVLLRVVVTTTMSPWFSPDVIST